MKKWIALLLIAMLALTACMSNGTTTKSEATEAPAAAADPVTADPVTEAAATDPPATEPPETEAPKTEAYGSRKNPAELGETVEASAEYGGDPIEFEITLTNLIRGEEAHDRMIGDNQFNEIGEDEEVVYATVDFTLVDYVTDDDDAFLISDYDFRYYKIDYSSYDSDNYIVVSNEIFAELYPGASTTGTVAFVIPKDDVGYILYKDFIWFKLPE